MAESPKPHPSRRRRLAHSVVAALFLSALWAGFLGAGVTSGPDCSKVDEFCFDTGPIVGIFAAFTLSPLLWGLVLAVPAGRFEIRRQWPIPTAVVAAYLGSAVAGSFALGERSEFVVVVLGLAAVVWAGAAVHLVQPGRSAGQQARADRLHLRLAERRYDREMKGYRSGW